MTTIDERTRPRTGLRASTVDAVRQAFVDDLEPGRGSATVILLTSIRPLVPAGTLGLQTVMLFAISATLGVSWASAPVIAGTLAMCVFALWIGRPPRADALIPVGMVVLAVVACLSTTAVGSPLVLAAIWQMNVAACFAGLLVLDRRVTLVVVGWSLIAAGMILALRPAWGLHFAVVMAGTQLAIIIGVRLGMCSLLRLAHRADAAEAGAERAASRAAHSREISQRLAEDARTIHDTAINTLGAIADEGTGRHDARLVRAQCERDARTIDQLSAGRPPRAAASLLEMFGQATLPVRREGLDDETLKRLSDALPPSRVDAIVGGVREAVNNAARHSGDDGVTLSVTATADTFRVTVSDRGCGFDVDSGRALDRGLQNSILQRASDAGVTATIESERGVGTRVALSVPRSPSAEVRVAATASEGERFLRATRRHAAGLWAAGGAAVGVILILIWVVGVDADASAVPMAVVMALAWLLFRFVDSRRWRFVVAPALLAMAVATFVLSAVATHLGTVESEHWRVLAASGPVVLFLAVVPGRVAPIVVTACLGATALVLCVIAPAGAPWAVPNIVVAAGLLMVFVVVWLAFQELVERVGRQFLEQRRIAFLESLAADLDDAARAHYQGWMDAGLETTAALLHDIARGAVDFRSAEVRALCSAEEQFLRQIIDIGPDRVHLGRAMIPTLRYARRRGIVYRLRLASVDVPRAEEAEPFAQAALHNLRNAPAGSRLAVSVFAARSGIQLTIVGANVSLPATTAGLFADVTTANGVLEAVYVPQERKEHMTGRGRSA